MLSIEVSENTYTRLLRRSASFSDTPEDVVVRLLDKAEASPGDRTVHQLQQDVDSPRPSPRATPGSILPEREYWRPILEILDQSNGAAAASDVIETLGEQMQDVLTPRDYETLAMGEVRWRNRARFARLRMTERGLLSSTSHRGIWEITELGREYLGHTPATPGEADSV
jgi:hypothetical protein